MNALTEIWIAVQAWLFETFVSPVLFHFGLMGWFDEAFDAVEFFMLGVLQILVIAFLMRPVEALWPLEATSDNRSVAVDRVYTILNKLGAIPLVVFAAAYPITNWIELQLREWRLSPPRIENLLPWTHDHAFVSFLIYFAIYDLAAYGIHRAQHRFSWWWALHSLHHSQRRVTAWTDDRNHILDNLLVTLVLAVFSQIVGVQPADYVSILVVGRLIESWSHANVDIAFGRPLRWLLVSPRFHRLHHAMAGPAEAHIHDHNFAAVLPVWDVLFGTALYDRQLRPTGVPAPEIDADNGRGWFSQQVAGIRRLSTALFPFLATSR
ncbi:MAG TPA: sterol desaturase family protein [Reyranella sp.]|nr:sterol desaturase family protein [Reyranella sp.]